MAVLITCTTVPLSAPVSASATGDLAPASPPSGGNGLEPGGSANGTIEAPLGRGMEGRPTLTSGGYFRSEFFYRRPNLYFGYDDILGTWLPRGSPYTAFGLVSPAHADAYAEANLELTWNPSSWGSTYADTSVVFSTQPPQQSSFEQAQDVLIGLGVQDPNTASSQYPAGVPIPGTWEAFPVRPRQVRLQINELYLALEVPDWASAVVGKRRLTWGSAFTWTPLDVVNPRFNPLEPTLQREGAWTAALDLTHFYRAGMTLLYRPWVQDNEWGLPTEWDFDESLFAGRLYLNLFMSDINLVGYLDRGRGYGGMSFSRYFGDVELHLESLVQRGRPTWLVRETGGAILEDGSQAAPYEVGQFDMARCRAGGDCRWYPDIVFGGRYTFDDGSTLLVEYLYHGPGYDAEEYGVFRAFTSYLQEQLPHVLAELPSENGTFGEEAAASWAAMVSNAPYLYQETNTRVNYLGMSFLMSEVAGIVEPRVSAICNVDDGSVIVYPSANFWMSRGRRGPGAVSFLAGVMVFLGHSSSQVALYPAKFSANLRATARF